MLCHIANNIRRRLHWIELLCWLSSGMWRFDTKVRLFYIWLNYNVKICLSWDYTSYLVICYVEENLNLLCIFLVMLFMLQYIILSMLFVSCSVSVESTALKLIMGLGSWEVQPQLSRVFTEPKSLSLLSSESEELNRTLVLTLARAMQVTGL